MNAYLFSLNPEANLADQWDYGFLKDFLEGRMWQPPNFPGFDVTQVKRLPEQHSAIVALPARHHAGMEELINKELSNIDNVVLFLMGDEEADFAVEMISHPRIHIWVQNPHPGRHDKYNKLGTGYPPQAQLWLKQLDPIKPIDLFFSGQITHDRRHEMFDILLHMEAHHGLNAVIDRTNGFTQGMPHEQYYEHMASSRIVPAPSGAVIPDSFRLFEALESMALPIADEYNSDGSITQYWDWLFDEIVPFPKITNWDRMYGLVPELLEGWPGNMHQVTAWWIAYKREFAYKVCEQLNEN